MPRPFLGIQYERWGSRYSRRDNGSRQNGSWKESPGRRQDFMGMQWYNRNVETENQQQGYSNPRFGAFQLSQPTKSIRFSEWIQSDRNRHGSNHLLVDLNKARVGDISPSVEASRRNEVDIKAGKSTIKGSKGSNPTESQNAKLSVNLDKSPPIAGRALGQDMFNPMPFHNQLKFDLYPRWMIVELWRKALTRNCAPIVN